MAWYALAEETWFMADSTASFSFGRIDDWSLPTLAVSTLAVAVPEIENPTQFQLSCTF